MRSVAFISLAVTFLFLSATAIGGQSAPAKTYLGFDANDYPGDDALPTLRKTFSFTSYWIGPPPEEKTSSWLGKRALLRSQGFGFVVLWNGRDSRTLKSLADGQEKGKLDAQSAATAANHEGFPDDTVIFLDIEEGGRLSPAYHAYVHEWIDELARHNYRAGVYCSAMPTDEGGGLRITTAQNLQDQLAGRKLVFWVYNDACPPAPGCAFPVAPSQPGDAGFAGAAVWQYAQSPRRKQFTAHCPVKYAKDNNCYAPGDSARKWFLDVNVANTPDPSAPLK